MSWDGPGEDLEGAEFGGLTVEAPAPVGARGVRVAARCTCGRVAVRYVVDLVSGAARACRICRPKERELRDPVTEPEPVEMAPYFRDPAIVARFFAKARRPLDSSGCLLWTASTDKDGYGRFQVTNADEDGPKQWHLRAPRFALAIRLDRWPGRKLVARHQCDDPSCVEPEHLAELTQAESMQIMARRGRVGDRSKVPPESRPRGDRHTQTKIPDSEVPRILRRRAKGHKVKQIAWDYAVHPGTIYSICAGRIRKPCPTSTPTRISTRKGSKR